MSDLRRMPTRKLASAITMSAMIAAGCAGVGGYDPTDASSWPETPVLSVLRSADMDLQAVDAVVVVQDVSLSSLEVPADDPSRLDQPFQATVVDVPYQAPTPVMAPFVSEPVDVPSIDPAQTFNGFNGDARVQGVETSTTDLGRLVKEGFDQFVLVADFRPGFGTHETDWYANPIGLSVDGSLHFSESVAASQAGFDGLVADVRNGLVPSLSKDTSDIDIFAALVRDSRAIHDLAVGTEERDTPRGGIVDAYLVAMEAFRTPDLVEAWDASDPHHRFVDIEGTPPSIMSNYSEIPIQIVVSNETRKKLTGLEVVVRTPSGVSHLAEVAAGTTIGVVYVQADEPIEVWLADAALSDEGVLMGSLDASMWSDALAIQISLKASMGASFDREVATSTSLFTVFTDRLDWFEAFNTETDDPAIDDFTPHANEHDWQGAKP